MKMFDIMQTIFNFFSILYIHRFMIAFFDNAEKRKSKWLTSLYLVYPILTSIVYLGFNYPILNLLINLISLFVISLQYRASIGQRIISVGLTYFCMIIIESICAVATSYLGASAFKTGTYRNIAGLMMCNMLVFAVSLVVYNFKNMKKSIAIPKSLWLAIACIPILSVAATLVILHNNVDQAQSIIIITVFLFINGFTFYLYDALVSSYNAKLQSVLLAEEKECYYNQCQFMQQSEYEMSSFRHDVRNQLDMIYELLKVNSTDNIKDCVEKMEQKINTTNTFSKTGHIALDSILNLKLSQANQNGITVICESDIPKDLQLDASDLMVILGNLLDNAITAAEKVENDSFIKVQVSYEKGMLFIAIENAYCEKIIEEHGRLFTTKKNKEQHGYGISNVKKILESYHGIIDFNHTKDVFRVDTALYCKPSEA